MATVRAYLRVSTGEQAESGLGLEAQRAAIVARASREGWATVEYVDAGYSGGSLKRPAVTELLNAIQLGDVLIVAKLCRISRSLSDFAGLVERSQREGWTLVCLDPDLDLSTPNGRLVGNVLAAVVQWEREIIGQRVKEALAAKKARGEKLGADPVIVGELASMISGMREVGMTMRRICEQLNSQGVPTPRGGVEWRPSSIQGLLAR